MRPVDAASTARLGPVCKMVYKGGITALTGLAASDIGGTTLYYFAGIGNGIAAIW